MNFDFLYHSYSLTITIFAAVFGMAYPLMLQAIERIDDKYTSSVLATDLRKRWQFRTFNWLIIICIILLPVLAFVLESTDSIQEKYVIVSFATMLIVFLMVDVVWLVKQILVFYSPKELFEHLDNKDDIKNADALLDLARYAEKVDEFILYISSLTSVFKYILDEQKKISEDKPVEYSEDVYDILAKIAKKVGNTSLSDDRYNYVGIVPVIYNNEIQGRISAVTFLRMWEMVNRAVKAGNTGWFRDYWTYANQYYRFAIHNTLTEQKKSNINEFYYYHVMIGALLVYFKRFDWLRHIMHFTQELPAHFVLIPGTISKIFEIVHYLEGLLERPFDVYQRYQFYGLDKGVKMDETIVGYAYRYLALLIIRIWTYKDYNYNYSNPLDLPLCDDESIEANDDMIICVEQMKREVGKWFDSGILNDFGFSDIPSQKEITDKLDEYILALKMKIKEIESYNDVDENKVKVIKDEIIVSNANSSIQIPMMNDGQVIDDSFTSQSIPIMVSQSLEKPYITKGSKKSMGNFGSTLVYSLNYEFLNEYLRISSILVPSTVSYNINQKDLLDAIDLLELTDDYMIIVWGNVLDMYELKKRLTYQDNEISYNGHKVLNLGMSRYSACVWLIKDADVPFVEITDTSTMSNMITEIDSNNHLYSNIDHLKPPFDIQLIQSIKVYAPKKYSKTCQLKVAYDFGNDRYDIDKVVKLC